jgi:hypothetical protein
MDSRLLGIWESDPADSPTMGHYGQTRLHFFESGALTYTIRSENLDQVIRLTYDADGDTITTQQPSSPREERTKYAIDEDGRLSLNHDGVVSRYRRL